MENKVGLYRMLVDASCAISQNLSALSDFMSDDAIKSARKSLREILLASIAMVRVSVLSICDESK